MEHGRRRGGGACGAPRQTLPRCTRPPRSPNSTQPGFLNPANQSGGSGLPMLRTLKIDAFPLYSPRKLSKRLNAPGALSAESRREVAEQLTIAFSCA